MKINNKEAKGNLFAYDGCHKIYILEDEEDEEKANECGYKIYNIKYLKGAYLTSCGLRFISNWKLTKNYVGQGEKCIFE